MTDSTRKDPSRLPRPVRVLYSFPHKIGADRICHTAWSQVDGLAKAGAEMLVHPGVLHRPFAGGVRVDPTLAWGGLRVSYKLLGTKRACAWHDAIVARRLEKLGGQIDIVHTWPMGALRTLKEAARLGLPTVLERPNAHTRFAYEVVQKECEKLGITMPAGHEHAMKEDWLKIEEEEYERADYLLCPSDFVAQTFLDRGFPPHKLLRHQYGFDEKVFHPAAGPRDPARPFTMLFAGGCAPRKGLHYALEAWLQSSAHRDGKFLIAGGFIPGYAERLTSMLSHPSVEVLGHRRDVQDLMRRSDVFVLPTIEEGSALVTSEARGCGCVILVSEAAGAICEHEKNAFVHRVGDVAALARHITLLHDDRGALERMRTASLQTVQELTWDAAGRRLLAIFQQVLNKPTKSQAASA
ncbi:MAG TPA: glycosyltransferase family 4 protein [Lacunisphaera sp.]|nr:glycosyltransferase family 4 protein [Lacunisphaera sp.]